MINFLHPDRRIGTYETYSGEHGLIRYSRVVTKPEIGGFQSGSSERVIVEAIFVEAADFAAACLALVGRDGSLPLAPLLAERGICFRQPHGVRPKLAPVADAAATAGEHTATASRRKAFGAAA